MPSPSLSSPSAPTWGVDRPGVGSPTPLGSASGVAVGVDPGRSGERSWRRPVQHRRCRRRRWSPRQAVVAPAVAVVVEAVVGGRRVDHHGVGLPALVGFCEQSSQPSVSWSRQSRGRAVGATLERVARPVVVVARSPALQAPSPSVSRPSLADSGEGRPGRAAAGPGSGAALQLSPSWSRHAADDSSPWGRRHAVVVVVGIVKGRRADR